MSGIMNEIQASILNGREVADRLIDNVRDAVSARVRSGGRPPGLAVVLVGDDPASQVYVGNKIKACERAGIVSKAFRLQHGIGRGELLALIDSLNQDDEIDGILVQLPLPSHLDEKAVTARIDPAKDVDGFHPRNMGRLCQRDPGLRPCTPRGIMTLLGAYAIDPKGAHVVIVGASNIVGRPLALEMLLAGATVTVCHRFTRDLERHVEAAEILCVAVGKPGIVRSEWVSSEAVVIDIGISRDDQGAIHGDLDHPALSAKVSWITPVPGGVGPMTVATLLQNTAEASGLVVLAP